MNRAHNDKTILIIMEGFFSLNIFFGCYYCILYWWHWTWFLGCFLLEMEEEEIVYKISEDFWIVVNIVFLSGQKIWTQYFIPYIIHYIYLEKSYFSVIPFKFFFSFQPSKSILLWKLYKIITNDSFPSKKVKTQVHFFSNLSSIYPYFSIFLNMVSHLSSECEFENSYRYFLTRNFFFLNNFV